jgi:hypothetical protein
MDYKYGLQILKCMFEPFSFGLPWLLFGTSILSTLFAQSSSLLTYIDGPMGEALHLHIKATYKLVIS